MNDAGAGFIRVGTLDELRDRRRIVVSTPVGAVLVVADGRADHDPAAVAQFVERADASEACTGIVHGIAPCCVRQPDPTFVFDERLLALSLV